MGNDETHPLLSCDFNLHTELGAGGLYDLMVYKAAPYMNCITEEFLTKHRYRKPEKIQFLQDMLASKLGLYLIKDVDSSEGYVYLENIFTGKITKIVDVSLSSRNPGKNFYLYTRIINYQGISFGTGFNLSFDQKDKFIQQFIKKNRKADHSKGELIRFVELFNYFSGHPHLNKTRTNPII